MASKTSKTKAGSKGTTSRKTTGTAKSSAASTSKGSKSKMSTGTKVAIGAAASAGVLGAATALAHTQTGRKVVSQAGEAARDLKNRAAEAASQVVRKTRETIKGDKGAKQSMKRGGDESRSRVNQSLSSSSSIGGRSLGGASLGGYRPSGSGLGMSNPSQINPAGGFETKPQQRFGAKLARHDATRSAVRGHSGAR